VKPAGEATLSAAELRQYSEEHLHYELSMLLETGRLLSAIQQGSIQVSQVEKSAYIESFCIHARNLIAFLYPTGRGDKDHVKAEHYFANPMNWKTTRPKISNKLSDARDRVSKEIGHLTTSRESIPAKKRWPVTTILRELKTVFEKFVECCDSSKLDSSLSQLVPHLNLAMPSGSTDPSTPSSISLHTSHPTRSLTKL